MKHPRTGSLAQAWQPAQSTRVEDRIRKPFHSLVYAGGSIFIGAVLAFVCFVQAPASQAASLVYQAKGVSLTAVLQPGEKKQITVSFKNIGTQTWIAGVGNTAVYLNGNSSLFSTPSWLKDDLPTVISQPTVSPGQTATATFWVQAPKKAGSYKEKYILSYGNNLWIKGSTALVTFNVGKVVAQTATAQSKPVTQTTATATAVQTASVQTKTPNAILSNSPDWKAQLVDRGGIEWQMQAGDQTSVTLAFENTGIKNWSSTGTVVVSANTSDGNNQSPFQASDWLSSTQAAVLQETLVKPHQIGHFKISLKAPDQPGSYSETFQLAAGNTALIANGAVALPIHVTMPLDYIAKGISNGLDFNSLPQDKPIYQGQLISGSAKNASLTGDDRATFTFAIKNTGTASWNTLSLRASGVNLATVVGQAMSFRDPTSWLSSTEAMRAMIYVPPGQLGYVNVTIKAPVKKGSYTAHFSLYADEQQVSGADIDIPVTVTADGYIAPQPIPIPSTTYVAPKASNQTAAPPVQAQPLTGDVSSLPAEPIIRVGLFHTNDDTMVVRGVSTGFNLTQNGTTVCSFSTGDSLTVKYSRTSKIYTTAGTGCNLQSSSVYVAVAADGISPLEITDISVPVSWLPGANDNKFRAKLELRYTPATDLVWVINELPIEWYLKGIGETSNSSPQEYQRALLTAARTYAMYHVYRGTKHADENYTVDAKYDQVYRGYGAEIRDPNVVTAVDATRGQIVTYNGNLAITPYYSRSDGRTRAWTEVWGGSGFPWLVSVSVPWDQGKTLWGHGVGMSATGALGAAADGWTYDRILKHFYTSTELRRAYK